MDQTTEGEKSEKIIKIITKVFTAHAIYQTYKNFDALKYLFTDSEAQWSWEAILLIAQLIWLPLVVFLFSKKLKMGWVLLFTFIIFLLTDTMIAAVTHSSEILGGKSADNIIGTPLIVGYILVLTILPTVIYFMCLRQIRIVFRLTDRNK